MNLTALRGRQLVERLVAEPLWVGEQLQMKGTLVDIGSGNGCPAVPLCIGRQLSKAHLIEARAKRAAFLRHLSQRLDVPAIVVHKDRLEDVESFGPVDWITLQAVSPTAELLRAMRPLASSTTQVVWITSSDEAPIASAERVSVPGSKTRIWVFRLDHS
jgi:16S rRNA (guanine527-N7)-methyltransferase